MNEGNPGGMQQGEQAEPTLMESIARIRKIVEETPGVRESLLELLEEHRALTSAEAKEPAPSEEVRKQYEALVAGNTFDEQVQNFADALRAERERVAELLEADNHYWQRRPCETCSTISAMLGRKFGCVAKLAANHAGAWKGADR